MKAIVAHRYGAPETLTVEEVEKPAVEPDQVLVRVRASSVNPYDWHLLRGSPFLVRLSGGLFKPKNGVLGVDAAGVVEQVGANVTHVAPGDEVFGARNGAFAEYVSGKNFIPKPANLTFEQAGAVGIAGITALQAVRDKTGVQAGHKVLVNGAAGGVGTFAVQIAKAYGADVTAVCSARNADLVRSIGADRVVDYSVADYTREGRRYDAIVDCMGNHGVLANRRALTPNGALVRVGGPLRGMVTMLLLSRLVRQRIGFFLAAINRDDLAVLAELMAAGKVTPVIDRTYPLGEVPEAIAYLEEGHARGKVVISVS
ncbi:MAG TPA: NAD(P)-dependent alcohol dehydrogenase [Gaiellaceae bacterium]|nr:NAD(P)-dependent alcohol dehydrogenase [Gaiellaceae bacterium]